MTVLLIATHDNITLGEATARALTAVLQMDRDVHVLVAGSGCAAVAEQAAELSGVAKVLLAEADSLAAGFAEPMAALVVALASSYGSIAAAADASGKNVMPRIAALLDVMQVSDVIRIVAPDTFERPIYAGNAIETVRTTEQWRVLTLRSAAFAPAARQGSRVAIERVAVAAAPDITPRLVSTEFRRSARPDLSGARVVISGGRAFQSADNFRKYLEPVADKLKAAIGASRAAVDAGYASNDMQVGQTGRIVAPDLYIACGISGAIQHLAGMKESRVIVAINSDPDAPIFAIADYGLVGDVFEILPELERAL